MKYSISIVLFSIFIIAFAVADDEIHGLFGSYYSSSAKTNLVGTKVDFGGGSNCNDDRRRLKSSNSCEYYRWYDIDGNDPLGVKTMGGDANKFYIEWTGYIEPEETGCYELYPKAQGEGQIYIDGVYKGYMNHGNDVVLTGKHQIKLVWNFDNHCGDNNSCLNKFEFQARKYKQSTCKSSGSKFNVPLHWLTPDRTEETQIELDPVSFGENMYAALDGTKSDSSSTGCHLKSSPLEIPDGWEIAEPTAEAIAMLSRYKFGTQCMVMSDGSSYQTSGDFATKCHDNGELLKTGDAYAPVNCNQRILITKRSIGEATEYIGDVIRSFVFGDTAFGIIVADEDDIQCSTAALKLPENWELAPYSIAGGLVSMLKLEWSGTRVVFANGDVYDQSGNKINQDMIVSLGDYHAINSCSETRFMVVYSSDVSAAMDMKCKYGSLSTNIKTHLTGSTPENAAMKCLRYCDGRNTSVAKLGADGNCYCGSSSSYSSWGNTCSSGTTLELSQCRTSCLADSTYSDDECEGLLNEPYLEMNVGDIDIHDISTAATITEYVERNGYMYATLDNASMRPFTSGKQMDPMPLPSGWEIAPVNDDSIFVYKNYGMSTDCVIYGTGKAACSSNPTCERKTDNLKSFVYKGITYYYPQTESCSSGRIMIRKTSGPDETILCGQCRSTGDPHFMTFDGYKFDFQGLGSHYLVKPEDFTKTDYTNFEIYAKHKKLGNVATNEIIGIRYKDETIEIRADARPTFFVNDVRQDIDNQGSYTSTGGIAIRRSDITYGRNKGRRSYSIGLPNAVYVRVDARFWRQDLLQVYINLPNRFKGETGGLCGSCDGVKSNDVKCPDITELTIPASRSNIYNYLKDCWTHEVYTGEPFEPEFEICKDASEALKQKAYEVCLALPEDERDGCMIDVCNTGDIDAGEPPVDPEEPIDPIPEPEPEPQPACSAATSISEVTYGGITYGLLSGANVQGEEALCGDTALAIPDGWTLADDTPAHKAALGCFSWSSDCVVFSNGKAYNKDLTSCGENQLKIANDNYCYSVKSCSKQVLIVKTPDLQLENADFADVTGDVLDNWTAVGDGYTIEDNAGADGLSTAVKLTASANGAGLTQTMLAPGQYSSPTVNVQQSDDLVLGVDGYLRLKVLITYKDDSQATMIANAGTSTFWEELFVDVIPSGDREVKNIEFTVELKGTAGSVLIINPRIEAYSGVSSNLLLAGAFGDNASTAWTLGDGSVLDATKDISSMFGTSALSMTKDSTATQQVILTQSNPIPFTGVYYGVKGSASDVDAATDLMKFKITMTVVVDDETDKSVIYEKTGISEDTFSSIEQIGVVDLPIKYFDVSVDLESSADAAKAFFDGAFVLPSCRTGASATPLPLPTGGDDAECPVGYLFKDNNCNTCDPDAIFPCGGHGTCQADGTCDCDHKTVDGVCVPDSDCTVNFWYGETCNKYCHPMNTCSGHGVCDMFGDCICDLGFSGDKCNKESDNLIDIDATITKYHVYTDEGFDAIGNCDGLLAVGGDCRLQTYGIGYATLTADIPNLGGYTNRNDLVVGGALSFEGGAVTSKGNVWVGNMASSTINPTNNITPPGKLYTGLGLDFPLHTARLKALSEKLAALPATGSNRWHTDAPRRRVFYGTRSDINVFEVECSNIKLAYEYTLTIPYDSDKDIRPLVIVNFINDDNNECTIDGGDFNGIWHNEDIMSRTIFNFQSIQTVHIDAVKMTGTVIAMQANVEFAKGDIIGHMFAKSLGQVATSNGVYEFPLFNGVVPWNTDLSGYWGEDPLPSCNVDHGKLDEDVRECECWDPINFGGDDCSIDCKDMCNNHGQCLCVEFNADGTCVKSSSDECECWGDWIGSRCTETNCGSHGSPKERDEPTDPLECECDLGWTGTRCNIVEPCINGKWNEASECECEKGWSGDYCDTPFWIPVTCAHGDIQDDGSCKCISGWQGIHCDIVPLDPIPSEDTCSHGFFNATSAECVCDELWDGDYCEWPVCNAGTVVLDYGEVTRQPGEFITQSCGDQTSVNGDVFTMYGDMRDEWCHVVLQVQYYNRFGEDSRDFRLTELPTADKTTGLMAQELTIENGYQKWVDMGEHPAAGTFGLSVKENGEWVPVTTTVTADAPDCVIRPPAADEGGANVRCECLDGYYGTDCTEHCRHTCGMRGTICKEDGTLYDECQCEDYYYGPTCEEVQVNEFGVYIPVVLGAEEYKLKVEAAEAENKVTMETTTEHCDNHGVCVPFEVTVTDAASSSSAATGRRLGDSAASSVAVSPIATLSLEVPSDLAKQLPSDTKFSMQNTDGTQTGICGEVTFDKDTNVLSGGVCETGNYSFKVYSDLLDVNDGAVSVAVSAFIALAAFAMLLLL
eukprot:TRINITY_DN81_c0_g4_i1.p1 TRINITY_DN81_c0_g4~~TRINITY_DN81_c0_g4_i1.p1  ORF type:complete len:2351 (-),score=897.00 TRINITY_DN81_c0_g4_i1:864-7916(-)